MAAIIKCFYCEKKSSLLTRTTPKGLPPQWACPDCLSAIEEPSPMEEAYQNVIWMIDEELRNIPRGEWGKGAKYGYEKIKGKLQELINKQV